MKALAFLSRFGRVLSTGASFVLFSLWGFSLGMFLFPFLSLRGGTKRQRRERFMQHMRWSWNVFNRFMVLTRAFGSIRVEGLEHFVQNRACLMIANHVTLVDIVAIGAAIQNFNCIVKESLWRHRFFGIVLRRCEFVPNVGSDALMALCEEAFKEDRPLVVFPSGTRIPPGDPMCFQRGAAQIALRTGVPIIPVLITCTPATLMKGQPWYRVPPRAADLLLRIEPPIEIPETVLTAPTWPLRVRQLNQYLESWFNEKLAGR